MARYYINVPFVNVKEHISYILFVIRSFGGVSHVSVALDSPMNSWRVQRFWHQSFAVILLCAEEKQKGFSARKTI